MGPLWGAEPRFEVGPAIQQPGTLLSEPRRTLSEPRRTLNFFAWSLRNFLGKFRKFLLSMLEVKKSNILKGLGNKIDIKKLTEMDRFGP